MLALVSYCIYVTTVILATVAFQAMFIRTSQKMISKRILVCLCVAVCL